MIFANQHLAQLTWPNSTKPRLNPRLCKTNNRVKLALYLGWRRRRPATFSLLRRRCRQHRRRRRRQPKSRQQRCSPAAAITRRLVSTTTTATRTRATKTRSPARTMTQRWSRGRWPQQGRPRQGRWWHHILQCIWRPTSAKGPQVSAPSSSKPIYALLLQSPPSPICFCSLSSRSLSGCVGFGFKTVRAPHMLRK